jgi:hypothetical protein
MFATWNYRVVCVYGKNPPPVGGEYRDYGVHEVYYNGDKLENMTADSVSPGGDDRAELAASWASYQRAFTLPVLLFDNDGGGFTGEEPPITEGQ